jgi:hypothetical protein
MRLPHLPLVERGLAVDDGVLGASRGQPHESAAIILERTYELVDLALKLAQQARIVVTLLLVCMLASLPIELAHKSLATHDHTSIRTFSST